MDDRYTYTRKLYPRTFSLPSDLKKRLLEQIKESGLSKSKYMSRLIEYFKRNLEDIATDENLRELGKAYSNETTVKFQFLINLKLESDVETILNERDHIKKKYIYMLAVTHYLDKRFPELEMEA